MLPKIDVPIYNTTLPITRLKIDFRPILVKEEKIILMATQNNNPEEMRSAVEQILRNVVLTKDFDANRLPIADIEHLLIQIRDKSLGGSQELEYTCNNEIEEDTLCNTKFKIKVDFSKLEIIQNQANDKIDLGKIGIKLKPPTFGILKRVTSPDDVFDYELLADAVDFIYSGQDTFKMNEQTKEEIKEFFDSMPKQKLDEIYDYIESMPRYEFNTQHKCVKCGFEHNLKVSDLSNFFQ